MDELIKILSYTRVQALFFSAKAITYGDSDEKTGIKIGAVASYFLECVNKICDELKVEFDFDRSIDRVFKDSGEPLIKSLTSECIYNDPLIEVISSRFGIRAKEEYRIMAVLSISSAFGIWLDEIDRNNWRKHGEEEVDSLRQHLLATIQGAIVATRSLNEFMFSERAFFYLSRLEANIRELSIESSLEDRREVFSDLAALITTISPRSVEIYLRRDYIMQFLERLGQIPPGHDGWVEYEELMEDIWKYVIEQGEGEVISQVTTKDGHERRDLVIINKSFSEFWGFLRLEFGSKYIVVEVKNKVKNFSKDTLNQLRIYLSKKSVGRFGILTVRDGKENHAISTAREYAYAHSDILILILDDQDIVELLISKTVFGSADKFLHRKIIEFELKQ